MENFRIALFLATAAALSTLLIAFSLFGGWGADPKERIHAFHGTLGTIICVNSMGLLVTFCFYDRQLTDYGFVSMPPFMVVAMVAGCAMGFNNLTIAPTQELVVGNLLAMLTVMEFGALSLITCVRDNLGRQFRIPTRKIWGLLVFETAILILALNLPMVRLSG